MIIVGGGFGGLSAGSLLAHDGYKVLVLEKMIILAAPALATPPMDSDFAMEQKISQDCFPEAL